MLLAYLMHFADTNADGCVSASELCAALAPFVPGPPEEEVGAGRVHSAKDGRPRLACRH